MGAAEGISEAASEPMHKTGIEETGIEETLRIRSRLPRLRKAIRAKSDRRRRARPSPEEMSAALSSPFFFEKHRICWVGI